MLEQPSPARSSEGKAALGPIATRTIDDVPGPRRWPVVGCAHLVDPPHFHQQVEDWVKEFGPLYRLDLGARRILVCADAQLNAAVLKDRPDTFLRTSRFELIAREMGFLGLFAANTDVWRRQRPMVMSAFDPAHIRNYFPAMRTVVLRLERRWRAHAVHDETFDLCRELMLFTVDITAGLAFGTDMNTIEAEGDVLQRHLGGIFRMIGKRLLAPVPYWHWFKRADDRQLERDLVIVHAAVADFIAQTRERLSRDPALATQPRNLIEAMVAARDRADSELTDEDLRGNVLTLLLAGEDTTANTLSWLLYFLSRHPATLAMARAEVESEAPGPSSQISHEQLSTLAYVQACIEETLRLKPVGPIQLQQAAREVVVGDVLLHPGELVMVIPRPAAMSPDVFPEPAAFRPERWLAGDAPDRLSSSKRQSSPFGYGPRICPGRYLAMEEMKLLIAMVLKEFDIDVSTPDGAEAQERLAFALTPVGLSMRLRERQPDRSHSSAGAASAPEPAPQPSTPH